MALVEKNATMVGGHFCMYGLYFTQKTAVLEQSPADECTMAITCSPSSKQASMFCVFISLGH